MGAMGRAGGSSEDRLQFAALASLTTVTAIVSSLGAPLVPEVATRYDIALVDAQWSLTATMIAAAVATPVLGRLASGERRRPVLLGGLLVVLAGTVLAALPLGFGALLVGRSLQGVGLALVPLALAVARDVWTGAALASRLSWLSVATVAGAGLGYPVTSVVAGLAGVAGAFWFGAALIGATWLLCVRALPAAAPTPIQRVDIPGASLLGAGMIAGLLGVSQGESWGWTSPATLALIACGAVLVASWIAWSRALASRGAAPLVDLALAARPGVLGPHLVTLAIALGMYGLLSLVVVIVQSDGSAGYGLDHGVQVAGLVLVPYALMSVSGSRVARLVARRWTPAALLPIGCAVFTSSLVMVALAHDGMAMVLLAMAVGGLGSGFTFSSLPGLIVPHVPQAETGSALAFNQLLRYIGFSIGSAASIALLEVYGGNGDALMLTCLTFAGLCLAAGVGIGVGALRRT